MELRVWVDGLDRVVSGVSSVTSCQEIIYALARATGHTGRFVLVEQWRSTERSLAPTDYPLQILHKWGEHARDVVFVLKCLDNSPANTSTGSMPYFVSSNSYPSSGTLPRQPRQTEATTVTSNVHRHNVSAISVSSLPGRSTESPLTIADNWGSRLNLTRPAAPPSYHESMKRRHMSHSSSSPVPFNHSFDSPTSPALDYMSLTQQISNVSNQRESTRLNILHLKTADKELHESINRAQQIHTQTKAIKINIEDVQNKIDVFNGQAKELEVCISALKPDEVAREVSGTVAATKNIEKENNSQIPGMWV